MESSVTGKKIITHSSITARPFFEKRGYRTVREQIVVRNGISLANFIMEKSTDSILSRSEKSVNEARLEK